MLALSRLLAFARPDRPFIWPIVVVLLVVEKQTIRKRLYLVLL